MYSTTTIAKHSRFSGKLVGTHQQLDQIARRILAKHLPRGCFFPSSKDIIHFEGARGPDGLKRKSPDEDDPSHLLVPSADSKLPQLDLANYSEREITLDELLTYPLIALILDHRQNLITALQKHDNYRAAFEAAWMAHYIADGLTPAHHFPLSEAKEELMTNKEFIKIFGEPIKGIMHGRSGLETARNNWLYWGAGGIMTKHVAFEYGVAVIAMTLPQRRYTPPSIPQDFQPADPVAIFYDSLKIVRQLNMYDNFRANGWTTQLAFETKDILLPEIARAIARLWYNAAAEAHRLDGSVTDGSKNSQSPKASAGTKTSKTTQSHKESHAPRQ